MPPESTHIDEEGVLIDGLLVVSDGRFRERDLLETLRGGRFPSRNPAQNVADLKAQVAACAKGETELRAMIEDYGVGVVRAYMRHVQANAAGQVRRLLGNIQGGHFRCTLDDGTAIEVAISIDRKAGRSRIDFSGTSSERRTNFNAPAAVCRAAVLYVFRTLLEDDIPLNEGCLEPLDVVIPPGCVLSPSYPAAVVAGNVETSQIVTDALYGALGAMAASQGTMNNFTFGNDEFQYYETICGGSGAGPGFDGTDAVHTHMTNTRITDPEILEHRYPVRVERFGIRRGSGGAGEFRGGNGVVRELVFLEPMDLSVLTQHRRVAPYGLAGGESGVPGRQRVVRSSGEVVTLESVDGCRVETGDRLILETPGGGGYGDAAGSRGDRATARTDRTSNQ